MKIKILLLFLLALAVYAEAQNIIPEIRKESGDFEYVIRRVDANATTDIDYITRIVVEIENKSLEKREILLSKAYLKNEFGSVYKIKSIDGKKSKKKLMMPEEKCEVSMNFERASGIVSFVVPSSVEMKNIDVSYSWEVETETIEDDKDKKHLDVIEPVVKEYREGVYKLYHEITPYLGYITLSDVRRSDPRDEFFAKKKNVTKQTFSDGYYYIEEDSTGKRQGLGLFVFNDGQWLLGEWKDGKRSGFCYWSDTAMGYLMYQGELFGGSTFNGRGIMLLRDGSVQMGKWENGHYKGNPEIITAEELWDFPIALPYIVIAQHIVNKEISDWTKRGMTENPEDWRERTKPENKERRTNDILLPWIREDYLANTASKSRLNMKLSKYDPINENFLIVDSTFGEMIVGVKKDEAVKFKALWESKSLQFIPTYFFNGNSVEVKTVSFLNNGFEIARVNNKLKHVVIVDINPGYEGGGVIIDPGKEDGKGPIVDVFPIVSDVDTAIPITNIRRERPCYVLIIANENYTRVSNVPYAINDGRVFGDYCKKTLGIRNDNDRIEIVTDASWEAIYEAVENMIKFVNAGDGDMDVIFYYAGHAFPDRDKTYLLPIQGTTTGYELRGLYDKLLALKAKSVVCFLDACFSGDVLASDGSRAVRIGHSMEIPDGAGNLVVITASSAEEYANPIKTEGHGMFTYFLLKKLKDSKGKINLGDLFEYVRENVKNESNKSGKLQIPQVKPSNSMKDVWGKMKL